MKKIGPAVTALLDALERFSDRQFVGLTVAVALVVRVIWVLVMQPAPVSDFAFYYDHAVTLAHGGGYTTEGLPTAIWPVGYPAFLGAIFWVTGPSLVAAGLANAVTSAATLPFVYRFGREVASSRAVPRVACVLLAVFPSQIAFCSLLSDSVLFCFLLWSGASMLVDRSFDIRRQVLAGLLFGLATLVRPYALLVPLVMSFGRWRGAGLAWVRSMIVVYGVLLAVVLPWTARNMRELDTSALVSTNGGINLYIGHNPRANGTYDVAAVSGLGGGEVERDERARAAALAYIREHPLRAMAIVPRKLAYLYGEDADSLRWNIKGLRDVVGGRYTTIELAGMAVFCGYYYLVAIAALGYAFARRARRRIEVDGRPLRLILYFSAIAAVFFGTARFHFPIVPAITLYAAALVCAARPTEEA